MFLISVVLYMYVKWCHIFCRPDGIGTVLLREKEKFDEIKERLHILLENQITHFR
jgi:hypothetical protein